MLRENANNIGLNLAYRGINGTGDDWIEFNRRRNRIPTRDGREKLFHMLHCMNGCCLKHNPYPNSMAHEFHSNPPPVHVWSQDRQVAVEDDVMEILPVDNDAIEVIDIE